jgi:hypothetical protein
VPGIDTMEIYSPVVSGVAFQIIIMMEVVWAMKAKFIVIETAFLYGELGELIFME